MAQNLIQDLASHLLAKTSIVPGASLSGTTAVNGTSVDTRGMGGPISGIFFLGAATGTPTALEVGCKLQESDDGSTGWADVYNQRTAVIDAASGVGIVQAHHTKRYVRAVATPAFTGGTSPAVPAGALVGGSKERV